ncbi:hypothetical protein [Lewinella sp. W8]|uniref:hypothetical protein n=1 Tax=Lewinella sp. W8 TaxID=2528208 RepID=UPI00106881D4|nr:hypothetical protein [Lewinella sp. W8]MTB52424.1 hypothetical protein [Lewinella sp. W8]
MPQKPTQPLPVLLLSLTLAFLVGCADATENQADVTVSHDQEKAAILATLNAETRAAFQRDYELWQTKWVHDPSVTKTYLNFADSTFSESIGWEAINQFVVDYFASHPEPEPVPEMLSDINVRLYETGAWVTYEQRDALRGRKRETRLMEKVDGTWRIAGMQTTIYGREAEK